MVACLDYIGKLSDEKLPRAKKLEFFAETRHGYGRTALIFSGTKLKSKDFLLSKAVVI